MHGEGRGHAVARSGSHSRTDGDSHLSKRGKVLYKTLQSLFPSGVFHWKFLTMPTVKTTVKMGPLLVIRPILEQNLQFQEQDYNIQLSLNSSASGDALRYDV